nr:hypothetical protein OG546_26250 [Streptomyces antimycoticus]
MSSTRRALKHKRDKRRTETETLRTARRDTLSILLSRAQRGVLSRDEAALLRTHVEAELAEGDAARASERGQQRAMERHRQRVEAAEDAIREAEQRAEQAARDLAAIREGVRACGGDPTHVQNVYAQLRMWRNHAEQAEHRARRYRLAWTAARRDRKADRAAMAAELSAAQLAGQARAEAERRGELADAVTAETKRLMYRRTGTLRERAEQAEQRLTDTRRYVDAAYDGDVCEGVRGDLRHLLDGEQPTYGAPVDPDAPIPYQLAEQAPAECQHPYHLHTVTHPGPECR